MERSNYRVVEPVARAVVWSSGAVCIDVCVDPQQEE